MDLPRRADENRPIPPHENATTDRPAARRSRDRGHGCARSRRRGDGRLEPLAGAAEAGHRGRHRRGSRRAGARPGLSGATARRCRARRRDTAARRGPPARRGAGALGAAVGGARARGRCARRGGSGRAGEARVVPAAGLRAPRGRGRPQPRRGGSAGRRAALPDGRGQPAPRLRRVARARLRRGPLRRVPRRAARAALPRPRPGRRDLLAARGGPLDPDPAGVGPRRLRGGHGLHGARRRARRARGARVGPRAHGSRRSRGRRRLAGRPHAAARSLRGARVHRGAGGTRAVAGAAPRPPWRARRSLGSGRRSSPRRSCPG